MTEIPHQGLITLSVMLATIMQVLDTTIANVALPTMTGDLGASQDTITWVLTSYIVASAIMTPGTGSISDRIGKCEFFYFPSQDLWPLRWLVALRETEHDGFVSIAARSVWRRDCAFVANLFAGYQQPRKGGTSDGHVGAGIMVGPIIGPTLGGWLTESFNWRWVFFVNLPVGIIAFLGCAAYLPRRPRRFDFFGFGMLSVGIGALQLMLDRGGELDWFAAPEIWIYLFLTLTGFWDFILHIMGAEKPFLEPKMFMDRNFSVGLVFIFVVGIILLASLALLPPMLARLFGYPTITTGL
jgi:DHA2 family multidrug resistance protein